MLVEPAVKLPLTALRVTPVVPLLIDSTAATSASRTPVVRLSARPKPFTVTSRTVSVPKAVPLMSVAVVSPTVNPRSRLFVPKVIPTITTPVVVITGLAPPVAGNGSLFGAGVIPAMLARDTLAPCPINFWLASRINAVVSG